MDGRPRFADFESRIGQAFIAATPEGHPAGSWTLAACRALPVPDLPQLAGRDCFSLTFRGMAAPPQGSYHLTAPDGHAVLLFAVPVAAEEMHVTVN